MEVHFSLPFDTTAGQKLLITGSIPVFKEDFEKNTKKICYIKGVWHFIIKINTVKEFTYSYLLKDESGEISIEAGPPRLFSYNGDGDCRVYDQWRVFDDESPFMSDPFRRVFFYNKNSKPLLERDTILSLSANNIPSGCSVIIAGNCSELGNWDILKAAKMSRKEDGLWYYSTNRDKLDIWTQYKFIITTNKGDIVWEEGENRTLPTDYPGRYTKIFINHFRVNIRAMRPRLCGTSIPVFSLRTKKSCGVGDFVDLKLMVDFLSETSQNILQLLPVNDTSITHTWEDSYPYSSISVYALHPLYINLELTGVIKDSEFMEGHQKKAIELNNLNSIDYESVANLKWKYLKKIFKQEGDTVLKSIEFTSFLKKNDEWLIPYAAFCYLRDKYKSADFRSWPKYSTFNRDEIMALTCEESKFFKEISIHYYIQFHLHKQLSYIREYANSKQIILKGDIPIGINKNSVEAWVEPHLFNFGGEAGAPPDDFSVKGQNWGFPTYNWDVMERDGFSWWKKRFVKMAEYFDAYRIDHILGFFRIWEIPANSIEGLMGSFNPALPLSEEEIRSFGYDFNYERDTLPYITDAVLYDYFGQTKEKIKDEFLEDMHNGTYLFKSLFSTQKLIECFFNENPESEYSLFRQELLSLCTEILFLRDRADFKRFHPRISAQFTKSYHVLSDHQKECYNRVYNHFFYERNESFWYHNAMKRLPSLISSTGMLVCGEDLGMIPSCVPAVMNKLSIMTLEIQRMPKDPKEKFGNPRNYPYLSVCTTGTHDTSTLRGWWEEDYNQSKSYYRDILGYDGEPPVFCEPWLCSRIVNEHLNSPSMLAILPLQDWLSMFPDLRREDPNSERINIPANPKHYWSYRMHLNIEDLLENKNFTKTIESMIEKSGRILES